jgi:DNA-binding transcriptional MerR regulator
MSAPQEQPQEQPPEPPPEPPPPEPEPPPPTYYPADDGRMFTSSSERDSYNSQLAAQRQREADAQSRTDAAISIWARETGQTATSEQRNAAYQTFLQNPSLTADQGIKPWIDKYRADLQAQKEAEAKQAQALNDAVTRAIQNGMTVEEIKSIASELKIPESQVNAALEASVGSKEAAQIVKDVSGLVDNNQISIEKVVKYADENKLPYATVADALTKVIPGVTTNSLVYEKDRQQFNALAKDITDPKDPTKTIKSVSYEDAVSAAIKQGIGLENLAKFFNQSTTEFKATVSSNLGFFADALRKSGINPELGLSDLLGIQAKDTAKALNTLDIDNTINASLKQKESGGLTYNEILDEIEASGMTIDDFVTRYFGQGKTDLLTGLKSESKFTPEQRDLRDDYSAFTSKFNKDNPLTYGEISKYLESKQLSDDQASSLFGISPSELSGYRTDTRLTNRLNQEKADDGKLSLSEILDVVDSSGMSINDFVKRYFGADQESLAASLTKEKQFTPEQRTIRETYSDFVTSLGDKKPTVADVAKFVDTNKLTDAQAETLLGVPAKDLGAYRRDTFITSGLNELEKSDNRLDYTEIVTFAKDNNIPFNEVAKYLAAPDKQESFVKTLEETQTDMGRSPSERLSFQLNQLTNSGKQSGTWDRNEGWDHHAEKMTNYLTNLGVTDLRNIVTKVENRQTQDAFTAGSGDSTYTDYRTVTVPHVIYYDKATGKELHAADQRYDNGAWEFGSEGSGKGSTGYILAPTSKDGVGGVGVTSQWREKYGVQEYAMPVALISAVVAPYLLPELIGTAVGGVELAALGGEAVAGTGLTGMLMSSGLSAPAASLAANTIVKGVYNGLVSEASGGDFEKGFITGGIAPAVAQQVTNYVYGLLPQDFVNKNASSSIAMSRAAGSAVGQLISSGQINPAQILTSASMPIVTEAIVKATDGVVTSNQAKFLAQTVFSGGNNITALANNPLAVLKFVEQNKGLIDEISSGVDPSKTSNKLNISALDSDQQKYLASSGGIQYPGSSIDSSLGTQVAAVGDVLSQGIWVNPLTGEKEGAEAVVQTAPSQLTVFGVKGAIDPLDMSSEFGIPLKKPVEPTDSKVPGASSLEVSPSTPSVISSGPSSVVSSQAPGSTASSGATLGTTDGASTSGVPGGTVGGVFNGTTGGSSTGSTTGAVGGLPGGTSTLPAGSNTQNVILDSILNSPITADTSGQLPTVQAPSDTGAVNNQSVINVPVVPPVEPTGPVTPVTPPTSVVPSVPVVPTTPVSPPLQNDFVAFPTTVDANGTPYVDYGYPSVPSPQLYGIFNLPTPEYTQAAGPMANVGIMSGATQ